MVIQMIHLSIIHVKLHRNPNGKEGITLTSQPASELVLFELGIFEYGAEFEPPSLNAE